METAVEDEATTFFLLPFLQEGMNLPSFPLHSSFEAHILLIISGYRLLRDGDTRSFRSDTGNLDLGIRRLLPSLKCVIVILEQLFDNLNIFFLLFISRS